MRWLQPRPPNSRRVASPPHKPNAVHDQAKVGLKLATTRALGATDLEEIAVLRGRQVSTALVPPTNGLSG